jgi:murein L,D-transpeptidase YcbB/YkuD
MLFYLFAGPGNGAVVADSTDPVAGLVAPLNTVLEDVLVIDWPQIERLNNRHHHRFIWHRGFELNDQGKRLFHWLASADLEGLDADDYHMDRLRGLIFDTTPDALLNRELLLSDGYLKLARDLRLGRYDAHTLDPLWMLPNESFDAVEALSTALSRGRLEQLFNTLQPTHNAYLQLKVALAKYRGIQAKGGWTTLHLDEKLQAGDRGAAILSLRQRLIDESIPLEGEPGVEDYFDVNLERAVKRFQRRLGLKPDGVVGSATLKALNEPVERRIAQIRANLERWRWMPHKLEPRHLIVNTAGFEITLREREQVVFHKRTVNGRQTRQTPSFSSQVTHLVMNPLWTIPRSIAVKDILPQLRRDRNYLSTRQIRLYARSEGEWSEVDPLGIDWEGYSDINFPFVLKQDAGDGNSLGRIKFHMPNTHQIYLHDTPARSLFERPARAFSSGCVRVEAADQLAQLLIDYADQPQRNWLQQALRSGETLISPLAKPMPVYLTYFTSWVDADGETHFRPDIYLRDTPLMLMMEEGIEHIAAHHDSRSGNHSL